MTARPLLVLAGGFGTRLQSATPNVPKVLAPVGARPFLQLLVEKWIEQGVRDFIFLLHHKADLVEAFLRSWQNMGGLSKCAFRTLTEVQPLGTGGAVAFAVRHFRLSGSFLVANADTWLGAGIREMNHAVPCAVAVVKVANADRYGSVRIQQGRVAAFEEKVYGAGARWINAGLYHLSPDLFLNWSGLQLSLEREVLAQIASAGRLSAVPVEADFIDIGIPEDYSRFCCWVDSGKSGVL